MSNEDEIAKQNYEATKAFMKSQDKNSKKSKKKEKGVIINTDF